MALGLFTRCDLSCLFVGPEKSWSKSARVNGDPMRARHVGRFGNIGCKITPLYAPNMFLSCSYTREHAHNLKWRAHMLLFAPICFFWWKAMRTKATICCVSSSILLLAAVWKCLKKEREEKEPCGLKTGCYNVVVQSIVQRFCNLLPSNVRPFILVFVVGISFVKKAWIFRPLWYKKVDLLFIKRPFFPSRFTFNVHHCAKG